eukprot:COSAG02_NODE_2661_length_8306_cov_942.235287_9_plen_99_part_00
MSTSIMTPLWKDAPSISFTTTSTSHIPPLTQYAVNCMGQSTVWALREKVRFFGAVNRMATSTSTSQLTGLERAEAIPWGKKAATEWYCFPVRTARNWN